VSAAEPLAPSLSRVGHAYEAAQLRWVTLNDAPRLAALWGSAYPDTAPSVREVAEWLANGGALALQDPNGELLAALLWHREDRGWRIERVASTPAARGLGYGRWLITKVEALAIRQNVPWLTLSLPDDDAEQRAYYGRMGYRVEGESAPGFVELRKAVGGVWQRKGSVAT
jgi:GNAT superfamily N-acetyltransferase